MIYILEIEIFEEQDSLSNQANTLKDTKNIKTNIFWHVFILLLLT